MEKLKNKKDSTYKKFKESFYKKNKFDKLDNCHNLNKDHLHEFLNSPSVLQICKILREMAENQNLPLATQNYMRYQKNSFEEIYANILSIDKENELDEISNENYIKINNDRIKLSKQKWNNFQNYLLSIGSKKEDDILNFLQNRNKQFSKLVKESLTNFENCLNYCKEKSETDEEYLLRLEKIIKIKKQKDELEEDNFMVQELEKAFDVKKKDKELEEEIKNYMMDKSSIEILNNLLKKFKKGKNIFIERRIINNIDYLHSEVLKKLIICIEKQEKKDTINIPLISICEKLGESFIDIIPFVINEKSLLSFNLKSEKEIESIKNLIDFDWLNVNKLPGEKEKEYLKFFIKNCDEIDSKTKKIIMIAIILGFNNYVKSLSISDFNKKNISFIETDIVKEKIIFLEKLLLKEKIKLGSTFLNYLKIEIPRYFGRIEKIKKAIINPQKIIKKNYFVNTIEIRRVSAILADLTRIHKPFVVGNYLFEENNKKNDSAYKMAYLQRLLNINHSNNKGYMKLKDSEKNNFHIQKSSVDLSGLLIFLTYVKKEILVYEEYNLNNNMETVDLEKLVDRIPLILSLYYLTSEEIKRNYVSTDDEGKKVIKILIKSLFIFENSQDEIFMGNNKAINKLKNKITGIKFSVLNSFREIILFSHVEKFYSPYFHDKVKRFYVNNKYMNIQSHYMIRGLVKPYSITNDYLPIPTIDKIMIKVANDLFYKKNVDLTFWKKKYNLNCKSLSLDENDENEERKIYKLQFFSDFYENEKFKNTINEIIEKKRGYDSIDIPSFLAQNIKTAKKLPLKLIEFFSLIDPLPGFGKVKKIKELDATSSGLQMQSILFGSKSLGIYSKLIEGEGKDIYHVAVEEFFQFYEKLQLFIENENIEGINYENYCYLSDYHNWVEKVDYNKYTDNLKKKCNLLTEDNQNIPDYENKKSEINFIKQILSLLMNYENDAENKINKEYKESIILAMDKLVEEISYRSEIIMVILNSAKEANFIHIKIMVYNYIINNPWYFEKKKVSQYFKFIKKLKKNQEIATFLFWKVVNIVESVDDIKLNADMEWFATTYNKKIINLCKSILKKNVTLTPIKVFKLRCLFLDIKKSGKFLFKVSNTRKLWKHFIMTIGYGSTAYGRKNFAKVLIEDSGRFHDLLVDSWAQLYDDYFSNVFHSKFLKDTDILKKLSNEVSKYVKETNEPLSIESEIISIFLDPKKYEKKRIALNSFKGKFRGLTLEAKIPKSDPKTNKYILDEKKIKQMFGATLCHMQDAFIVSIILHVEEKLNNLLRKKDMMISIETNHDCFRSNFIYLEAIIELCYLYLFHSKPFQTSFQHLPIFKNLLNILEKQIDEKDRKEYEQILKTKGLAKGFVKF